MKLEERLKQIEKRIAELQRKADWIKSQLTPITDAVVAEENEDKLVQAPRRRGRRKLNETE